MIFKKGFIILFLLCTGTLYWADQINAQQLTSATPSPEAQAQQLAGQTKDIWDQLGSLDAIASLISGLALAGIGWIGYRATNTYQEREIKVSQAQTATGLIPQLQSRYLEDIELAITLIIALGEVKLAMSLLEQYATGIAIPIFQKLLTSPNLEAAEQVEKSLQPYLKKLKLIEARNSLLQGALQYEQACKSEKEPSPERTVELENIISQMRSNALAAFPLLPELLSLIKTIRHGLTITQKRQKEDEHVIQQLKGQGCEDQIIDDIKSKKNYEKYYDESLDQEIEWMFQELEERRKKQGNENNDGEIVRQLKREIVDRLVNGIRLAAVSILQVQPSPDYLDWLAKLLAKEEDSFLGYHTAIALSNAVNSLKKFHSGELNTAIKVAKSLGRKFHGDCIFNRNSFQVLIQAEKKLEESTNS